MAHQANGPRVLVALDYADAVSALEFVEKVDPSLCRLKVGKELFTRSGPQLVEQLVAKGFDLFLDLKYHDIPNTTAAACRAAADLGVWMVNVHASGGRRMMEASREALEQCNHRPLLIAVTVLTSMQREDLLDLGIKMEPQQQVERLAKLTQASGLDGVVCSAQEASLLRGLCGPEFALVTPGIRPAGVDAGDQRRVMTPAKALAAGSDYLVIGRPITQAADPYQTLLAINGEIAALC